MNLVILGVLVFMAIGSKACNDIMYNSTVEQGAMSGRLMDLGPSLGCAFSYIPRGANLQGVSTGPDTGVLNYTAKYGFAFSSALQGATQARSPEYTNLTGPVAGIGADGLNEKGFSAAMLYDPGANETFATNSGSQVVVSTLDFATYALSQYASVAEAKAALDSGAVTISVPFSPIPEATQIYQTTVHWVLRDETHAQLVVEYALNGTVAWYSNGTGVLTNGPPYLTHLQQLQAWLSSPAPGQQPTYLTNPITSPFYQNLTFAADNQTALTAVPSTWWGFPGDYSSTSRFIRLSMLNMIAQNSTQYPVNDSATWSPASYPGGTKYKSLFDATESFLGAVALPLGVDDKGGVYPPNNLAGDFWQFKVIRDHVNRLYWFQTPSSPQWKMFDVAQLASQAQNSFNGYFLRSNYSAERPWFQDASAVANASPEKQTEFVLQGGLKVAG